MIIRTGGEVVSIASELPWALRMIARGVAVPEPVSQTNAATIRLTIESSSEPFDTAGMRTVTRGTSASERRAVMTNAGGSGLDLLIDATDEPLSVRARYRPGAVLRSANVVLNARFGLLACQVLVHYPVFWRASWRGRVPVHASVIATDAGVPLLAGPGGVGKSTVLSNARRSGAVATADNLCCADLDLCHGVAEPLRTDAGDDRGTKTSHGRVARPFGRRELALAPDRIVVLERGPKTEVTSISPEEAARVLVAGTYAAGELRRYWAYAATLALATGRGPAHPPIGEIATTLTNRLPCLRVCVGDGESISPAQLCGVEVDAQKGARR